MTFPDDLKPGDALLYSHSDMLGLAIEQKTAADVCHIEIYVGNGRSIAARSEGVNNYPFRREQLAYVLRPNQPIDVDAGIRWFGKNAIGDAYDSKDFIAFFMRTHKEPEKASEFCSMLGALWYRACAYPAFSTWCDVNKIYPAMFKFSPAFEKVWQASA